MSSESRAPGGAPPPHEKNACLIRGRFIGKIPEKYRNAGYGHVWANIACIGTVALNLQAQSPLRCVSVPEPGPRNFSACRSISVHLGPTPVENAHVWPHPGRIRSRRS